MEQVYQNLFYSSEYPLNVCATGAFGYFKGIDYLSSTETCRCYFGTGVTVCNSNALGAYEFFPVRDTSLVINDSEFECEYGCHYCGEGTLWDDTLGECVSLNSEVTCGEGTVWDPFNQECIVAIPTDTDFDGCVTAGDVLNLLATFGTCPPIPFSGPCQGLDHVTYQGHDYDIVAIGEQCWFAENLQAESYRNGDEIQSGLSDADWSSMSGATSVYGEGTSDCESFAPDGDACLDEWSLVQFGRLYNWHAVDDARELCPSGWHVPTVSDWMDLTEDLDSLGQAGVLMKTSTGWVNNGGGSNDSGFSGQPTGYRSWDGSFQNAGKRGYWWSQTPYSLENNSLAHYIRLVENQDHVNHFHDETDLGFSVRCIKD